MTFKEKKNIINILSFIMKCSTLRVKVPVAQMTLQDLIDKIKDITLESLDDFPKIQDVIDPEEQIVFTAVSNILNTYNYQETLISEFPNSSSETAKLLIEQYVQQRKYMEYSEAEWKDINVGLINYIEKVQKWVVNNENALTNPLKQLNSDYKDLKKDLKTVKEAQEFQGKKIKVLEQTTKKITENKELNFSLKDQYSKEGMRFYNYFGDDDSYSVKNLFLFNNYKKIEMSTDKPKLEEHNCTLENDSTLLQLTDINHIIEQQHILLITGLYGTGKTALMKKLYLEFEQSSEIITCFFQARTIIDFTDTILIAQKLKFEATNIKLKVFDKLKETFNNYCRDQKNVYIFIDELDEMNIELMEKQSYLELFISWLCEFQSENSYIHFILGSRKYSQIGEDTPLCVADTLFEQYFYHNGKTTFTIILTTNFSAEARNQWIQKFAKIKNKTITYSEIKNRYGKIAGALVNPIFLFAFMRRFIEEYPKHEIRGYYYYYSRFIEETISGRYGFGQKSKCIEPNTFLMKESYYKILRRIAFNILIKHEKIITAQIYNESIQEEQPVLAEELTSRKFEIQLSQLNGIIPSTEFQTASLINCYFFNIDRRRVYFTDTNILFSLAAEYIFDNIKEIVKEDNIFKIETISKIELVPLYPQLIDYVLYLTKNSKNYSDIFIYLDSFVKDKSIRSHYVDLSNKTVNRVEQILLLYILFVKTNKHSYQDKEYAHIFKEILYYVNAYKTNMIFSGVKERVYTIERYFMNINLHSIILKRANLKDFNFQGSKITGQSKFIQCNFLKTNMKDVTMIETTFKLCEISNVYELAFKTNKHNSNNTQAIFDNCLISNCNFTADNLVFRNCVIDELTITLKGERFLKFEQCSIKHLKVSNINNHKKKPIFIECFCSDIPIIKPFSKDEVKEIIKLQRMQDKYSNVFT